MECWRVLIRPTVFLAERLVNYSSPLRRGIHGIVIPEQAVLDLDTQKLCCSPTILDLKAAAYMSNSDGEQLVQLQKSLVEIINAIDEIAMAKGGCSSRIAEYAFPIILVTLGY